MGFFGSKKRRQAPSSPPAPKVDHLGYVVGQSNLPHPPPERRCQPQTQTQPQPQPQNNVQTLQPAGYVPSPPGWNAHHNTLPPPYQEQRPYGPIIVNQHYYLNPPPSHHSSCTSNPLGKLHLGSVVDLATQIVPVNVVHQVFDDGLPRWHCHATQFLNQGAALYDQIQTKFNDVMTSIDCERFAGNEKDLFQYQSTPSLLSRASSPPSPPLERGQPKKRSKKDAPKGQTTAVASSMISGGYFAKVELYANSRLPMDLPPLRLYIPTWPLICLAAQYSERVYERARGAERDAHVDADWRTGTKAMCIKSVPMDHMHTIVFAIRGTATFMDWAVNLNTAPTSPTGFLDDASNFCHAGFLSAAKKMIKPVAARLRQLLEENPNRSSYSLLITGHSAGGAIASLLYSHMLSISQAATSELNILTGCFKRVHCITFGTPPVSLLPLAKPDRAELKKSLFLSFINEGDPVARADKAYVKSLLELFATPAPGDKQLKKSSEKLLTPPPSPPLKHSKPKDKKSKSTLPSKTSKASVKPPQTKPPKPVWKLPPSTLSNAGRLVVLRSGDPKAKIKTKKTVEERLNEGVVAQVTNDEQLRGVVWGDPVCHVMRLYAGRIETLAVGAVTARGYLRQLV
ncbi:Alpha/Beta hydrolase protein [Truncatella angustata]|uniref:Alpha/Beta hydrolase protein n=1 Tax=Truncatella angustata TaxID=152316 RepID=A0A9P8UI19_9PEZI|nr:Alpha/Beta hydrolase protein [Truncatella angustata]KAH6652571.1 Alpha/Beta hydrolase protein [Truncatella angustata]